MPHRLDPLLNPESIVVVGNTSGGMGSRIIKNFGMEGIKASYLDCIQKTKAFGVPCYPDFASFQRKWSMQFLLYQMNV